MRSLPHKGGLLLRFGVAVRDGAAFGVNFRIRGFHPSSYPFICCGISSLDEEAFEIFHSLDND